MKKLLNLLSAVNLVASGLISVVSCCSSKINPIATPKSAKETIDLVHNYN